MKLNIYKTMNEKFSNFSVKDSPMYLTNFEDDVSEMLTLIVENKTFRANTLAAKDLQLFRVTEAALRYVLAIGEQTPSIVRAKEFNDYIERLRSVTKTTTSNSSNASNRFISIIDLDRINNETNDIIYYLVAVFDEQQFKSPRRLLNFFSNIGKKEPNYISAS